ncbi:MAG TPA: hypothetical protein VFY49_00450 [Myxococcota bacterium]|nr:hypothetical protein [Myxococcota bacterium]
MLANRLGRFVPILLLLTTLSCGAENLVAGFGNQGNTFGGEELERVAEELAKAPSTPAVSDDDLRAVFSAIRANALEGDPKAALVMLLVAGKQREPAE